MRILIMEIEIPIYYVLHNWLVHVKEQLRDIKRVNGTRKCYYYHWVNLVKWELKDVYLLLLINYHNIQLLEIIKMKK
jgi:hypothetical protein